MAAEDDGHRAVYELRFDTLAPGRTAAAFLAAHDATAAACAACGVPAPVARWWTRLGGRRAPGMVRLYRWPDLNAREARMGRFLASDAARALRWDGGAGGVIAGSESLILRAIAAAAAHLAPPPPGALHELRVLRVLNGATAEAAATLLDNELARARASGAALTGLYEVVLGQDRPCLVVTLAWPAGVAPSDLWLGVEAAADTLSRRATERARHHRRLFLGAETMLLDDLTTGAA